MLNTLSINHIVYLFSFLSFSCFAQQENDTLKADRFENFFGSDCAEDTVIRNFSEMDQLVLFKKENKLSRIKKGRVIWSIDLNNAFNSISIESSCIYPRSVQKLNRKTVAIVLVNKNQENWLLALKFYSGKIIKIAKQELQ